MQLCATLWTQPMKVAGRHVGKSLRHPPQLKSSSSHRKIWIQPNTWFLWPVWVHIPNRISIGSAVYAGLMIVTDRQTNWPHYAVCSTRLYLASTLILMAWQCLSLVVIICNYFTSLYGMPAAGSIALKFQMCNNSLPFVSCYLSKYRGLPVQMSINQVFEYVIINK